MGRDGRNQGDDKLPPFLLFPPARGILVGYVEFVADVGTRPVDVSGSDPALAREASQALS